MNSSYFLPNFWRFAGLVAAQAIILSEVALTAEGYCNILLYPLFILFLPIQIPTPAAVSLGFLVGLAVDIFSGHLGVNASAGALSGYARAAILHRFAPRGGFTGKEIIPSPANFGWRWFLGVAAIFYAIHVFWYFSMAYFAPVYLLEKILPQAILGWILSMLVVIIYTRLFHPKV
ncbi:MAG: hypothetical protein IPH12_05290 [Saprospirales bacterium]|nr:hypothetical protein [Saprospirales bacterium]MBK8923029.1 hypothetical protein [Saprospirales bacterium]